MLRALNFSVLRNSCNTLTRAGQSWRVSQGLPKCGNEAGDLHDASDWSYADGSQPPPTPKQKSWIRRRETKRARIQHLLDTAEIEIPKSRPILPKS